MPPPVAIVPDCTDARLFKADLNSRLFVVTLLHEMTPPLAHAKFVPYDLHVSLPPRDDSPGVEMSFHVAYRVKVADLKMVSYTYDELVGTSSRPSMDLNEEWDGTERPATLLVIRLLSGHYAVAVGFFTVHGGSVYRVALLDDEAKFESNEQRLLLGWVTPMGWYRVRLATNSQFWETVHGLACAKVVVAQSTELVRSQIYVLEECLCGLTENALLTATDNNSRQVLPVVALSAILLGIVTVVYAREWMHVFM